MKPGTPPTSSGGQRRSPATNAGYPNLAAFSFEKGARTSTLVATFHRRQKVRQDPPQLRLTLNRVPLDVRSVVEDIIEQTGDPDSIPMWVRAVQSLGAQAVRYALADLRSEQRQRAAAGEAATIKNPGAWLTTKFMAMPDGRGTRCAHHPPRKTRRR